MKKSKRYVRICAALLCAVLCMTAFATVAYADGGDYYDDEPAWIKSKRRSRASSTV